MHDGGSGTITTSDLQALAAFAGAAWGTNVITHMNAQVGLTHAHLSLYGADLDLLEADAALSHFGQDAGNVTPAQSAACISWRVGAGYRGGHPRNYICGLSIQQTANMVTLTTSFANTLAAGANTFLTNVNGFTEGGITDLKLVCMSFVRNKLWRTPPVAIPLLSATVDSRIDTQRRRLGPDVP